MGLGASPCFSIQGVACYEVGRAGREEPNKLLLLTLSRLANFRAISFQEFSLSEKAVDSALAKTGLHFRVPVDPYQELDESMPSAAMAVGCLGRHGG